MLEQYNSYYNWNSDPLEWTWYDALTNCLGGLMGSFSSYDNSGCCIDIKFESDPAWWSIQPPDPTEGNTIDLTSVTGYTEALQNLSSNCTIQCSAATIYINTTPMFFNGKSDPTFVTSELLRGYGDQYWTPSDPYFPGPWQDVTGAWNSSSADDVKIDNEVDFTTVIIHEMGHLWGLAHTDATNCVNTGGATCGESDPNSVMNKDIPVGTQRTGFTTDDCCRIQKLYFASSVPPCPADAVNEIPEPFNLGLEQSQPNPTTGAAVITFSNDRAMPMSIEVYDILGKSLLTLANQQMFEAGQHSVSIRTGQLPSGKYIYSLRANGKVLSKIMTVIE